MALITAVGLGTLAAADWISAGQLASKAVAPTSAGIAKLLVGRRVEKFWARAISDKDVRLRTRSARGSVAKELARLAQDPSVLLLSADATEQRILDTRRVLQALPEDGKIAKASLLEELDKGADLSTLRKKISVWSSRSRGISGYQ